MRRAATSRATSRRAKHSALETSSAAVVTLTNLHPLIQGALATILAALALSAWIAIGSFLVRRTTDDTVIAAPLSLLAGSGLTAFVYAILTRMGLVDGALLAVAAVSLIALVLQRDAAWRLIRGLVAEYRQTLRESGLLRAVSIPVAAVMWLSAIAPPRDADVMRYHLAHIRQIVSDGGWQPIADYHYALPFGWTLNYLPFERLHLPQAASLVNAALWLVMLAGLLRVTRVAKTIPPAVWVCLAFLAHPFVLRVFSTAMADGYAVFVVYSIAAMLATADIETRSEATLLGFACWIGAQTRYQLLAAAIAGTVLFIGMSFRRRDVRPAVTGFLAGATLAVVLSAPFYLVNLRDFGNPFWPLFIPEINGTAAYADRVAALYSRSLVGQYDLDTFALRFLELVTTPLVLPLALVLVLLVPASIRSDSQRHRRIAIFGTLVLILWAVAQPRLFPKHVILLLPLGPLLAVAALDRRRAGEAARRAINGAFAVGLVAMLATSAALSWDYIRYSLTGNTADFHRFTWYYPVYDWVNRNTPRDARFLVVTYSGHSYYLDRPYRRADPWLSGVVDWSHVSSAADVDKILREGRFDYMIYDDRDWTDFLGGTAMSNAVRSAVAAGTLVPVHKFREKLYGSRFLRDYTETTVLVLRPGSGGRVPEA